MKRYVFGKSVKGATHEKNGLPLQDNCKIEEISDKITIIAVADGHGSSKCPRSDRGSLIAVNTFCTVMKNYLLNYGKEKDGLTNLVTFLNREGDMRFAQDICEEWQARVKQSFYKNKDGCVTHILGKDNEGIIYRKNQVGMGNDPVQIIEKQRMKWRYCIDDEIIYMVSLLLCYYIIEKGDAICVRRRGPGGGPDNSGAQRRDAGQPGQR